MSKEEDKKVKVNKHVGDRPPKPPKTTEEEETNDFHVGDRPPKPPTDG
jgi:hypothetical protein